VILRNVSASDAASAKVVFGKLVKDGLDYEPICDYSVLKYGKEKKYIKVEMHNTETPLALMKNTKKIIKKLL